MGEERLRWRSTAAQRAAVATLKRGLEAADAANVLLPVAGVERWVPGDAALVLRPAKTADAEGARIALLAHTPPPLWILGRGDGTEAARRVSAPASASDDGARLVCPGETGEKAPFGGLSAEKLKGARLYVRVGDVGNSNREELLAAAEACAAALPRTWRTAFVTRTAYA